MKLSEEDQYLVEAACCVIRQRFRQDWHVVGAALRTRSGQTFTGIHLEAQVGRIAVCAEAIALGRAATEAGDTAIDTIVAVSHPRQDADDQTLQIISPCGMCRDMISDYSPGAFVIVPCRENGPRKVSVKELLPNR